MPGYYDLLVTIVMQIKDMHGSYLLQLLTHLE